ncbi:MAG: molybdopterin-binding protein [Alphaproteobacteria bacterium]|nr:molybdopterin-binding protein [Alphaproteobacteria bacterium]
MSREQNMANVVTACLIIIGNEILSGRTQDKNLAHLALKLNEAGIQLREARVIPDIEATIAQTVNACRTQFDYVFTTGGIGPTHDDITTASIAKAFGVEVHRHPEAEAALRAHYAPENINEARLKMADVPLGAELIPNAISTAPGFRMENVYVMAGIPSIMQAMLDAILPRLKGGATVLSLSITTNLPEGAIAAGLTDIQNRYPTMDIGSYPMYERGNLSTTLVLRSPDARRNDAARNEVEQLISACGGQIIPTPGA